jgi:hypothetical protein
MCGAARAALDVAAQADLRTFRNSGMASLRSNILAWLAGAAVTAAVAFFMSGGSIAGGDPCAEAERLLAEAQDASSMAEQYDLLAQVEQPSIECQEQQLREMYENTPAVDLSE